MVAVAPEPVGPGRLRAARVRQAAGAGGIGPDSPLAPFVESLAEATEEILDAPTEMELRVTPLLEQVQAATRALDAVAKRPLLTSQQVRYDVLPALVAAINAATAIIGVVLLLIAGGVGYGLHWMRTPTMACQSERGGEVCFFWRYPPTQPVQPAPAEQTEPPQPTPQPQHPQQHQQSRAAR